MLNWTATDNRGIKHYVVFDDNAVTITRHLNHGVILSATKELEDDVKYSKVLKTVKTIIGLDNELFGYLTK